MMPPPAAIAAIRIIPNRRPRRVHLVASARFGGFVRGLGFAVVDSSRGELVKRVLSGRSIASDRYIEVMGRVSCAPSRIRVVGGLCPCMESGRGFGGIVSDLFSAICGSRVCGFVGRCRRAGG